MSCSVDVFITLGHRANQKVRPSDEGFTHDWTVFVRGDEGSSIEHFVDKVVFNLHESFAKPKRVLKEQPFEVSEQGYAGFILPIDIHFKNNREPKKVTYEYDMFLRVDDSAYNSQKEKLTFHNPGEEFKKRLIRAGGVIHDNKANGSSSSETAPPKNRSNNQNSAVTNSNQSNSSNLPVSTANQLSTIRSKNVIPSKDKSQQQHLSAASNSTNHQSSSRKDEFRSKTKDKHQSKHSEFTDLFGTPIKTKSSSKDSNLKLKKSSSEKSNNNSRSSTPSSINNQLSNNNKDYLPDVRKRKEKDLHSHSGKLNKSNSSNSSYLSSHSTNRSLLQKDDKQLKKIKKEPDLFDNSSKIRSPANGLNNKYQSEIDRNNNHKYHSKQSNLTKSNLSSSSSSIDSFNNHQSRTKNKKHDRKRKKQSNSVSSYESAKSARSQSSSSRASIDSDKSSESVHSNRSRASSCSNYSTANSHRKQQKKRNNEDQYSPIKKKKKKDQKNVSNNNSKKESSSNISTSRNLSSSLSSINSAAQDHKSRDDLKKKTKDKFKENLNESKDTYGLFNSETKERSPFETKFKAADLEDDYLDKKERKNKKKSKDEKKSSKKNKSSKDFKEDKKKNKSSKEEHEPEKITKEKNKDTMNKQSSHKENNLKKEATSSTKISFSNNNRTGLTTLEISSHRSVKMLQSDSKKSKQQQDQLLSQSDKRSFKTSEKSNYSSPLTNHRNFDNETPISSPCSTATSEKLNSNFKTNNENIKQESTKDDYEVKRNQKLNSNYEKIMSDMRKDREISPLSSDLNSDVEYNPNDETGSLAKGKSYYGESDREDERSGAFKSKNVSSFLDDAGLLESDDEYSLRIKYVNELINLQKQINELKDTELLTEIVNIVRNSGMFEMNGTLFDFDLMKLDKTTIKKVKLCFP